MSNTAFPFTLIVTVGPATMERRTVRAIQERTPAIFRLNGAHLSPDRLREMMRTLRSFDRGIEMVVDLPAAKVRTAGLARAIPLRRGERFELRHEQVSHPGALRGLAVGEVVYANDGLSRFAIVEMSPDRVVFESQTDGVLENNKGLHGRAIEWIGAYLSDHDQSLLEVAVQEGASYVGLSYVRTVEDVRAVGERLRSLGHSLQCIVKIENRTALENLSSILSHCSCISIDRGDLASEIGILNLPSVQREIVSRAVASHCRVFCATQFLQTMVTNPQPLIAEIDSLFHAVESGIHGIQLSAETAIGSHVLGCIDLILSIVASRQKPGRLTGVASPPDGRGPSRRTSAEPAGRSSNPRRA